MSYKMAMGLLVCCPLLAMEKAKQKPVAQVKPLENAYSNEDRDSIITIVANLKYGHLLFPVVDSVFKASIKHALLDGKELAPDANDVQAVVAAALTNLSRTIKQTCPKKDFLDSVDMILEQMDDRYEEEAKPILKKCGDGKGKQGGSIELKTNMDLAYAAVHYEQFNQKDLRYMVDLYKSAPVVLQEKLQMVPKDTVQTWYAEFMKEV